MSLSTRPRRSMLYMPASNARLLEKAKGLAADGLIFDIEDAVAPDAKATARDAAVAAAKSRAYGPREVLIRVNGLDTAWGAEDLRAVATSGVDGVVLPKIDSAADVRKAADILAAAGAPSSLLIWAMMETPRGVLAAADVAQVNDTLNGAKLAGFFIGTNDLAKSLRCAHPADRSTMMHALQHCILAARAYGLSVIDGVHVDIADDAGLAVACKQGRDMGFDGKALIHPDQIATTNKVYAPSNKELERARAIIGAFKEAMDQGKGITTLNGRLVENLHVEEAERLIAQAETIARFESSAAG